jgi:hypothetical protein
MWIELAMVPGFGYIHYHDDGRLLYCMMMDALKANDEGQWSVLQPRMTSVICANVFVVTQRTTTTLILSTALTELSGSMLLLGGDGNSPSSHPFLLSLIIAHS